MDADRVNFYEACDKAIRAMNRDNLKAFGKLKLAKWDEVHIIRTVTAVYQQSAKKARKRYYEVAFEAYVLAMMLCEVEPVKAHRLAEKAITEEWVDEVLSTPDFVTMYRFDAETERKAQKLAETLEVATDRNAEIDRALKYWSQQLGQYAINFTDYAMAEAFEDAGVEMVEWISQKDHKVCGECRARDGQLFRLDEIPRKHPNCRCHVRPTFRNGED